MVCSGRGSSGIADSDSAGRNAAGCIADDAGRSGFATSVTRRLSCGTDLLLELRLSGDNLFAPAFASLSSFSNTPLGPELMDEKVWDEMCVPTESMEGLRWKGWIWGLIGLKGMGGCSSRSRKPSKASRASFFLHTASSCRMDKSRVLSSLCTAIWRERTRPDCIRMATRESLVKAISRVGKSQPYSTIGMELKCNTIASRKCFPKLRRVLRESL